MQEPRPTEQADRVEEPKAIQALDRVERWVNTTYKGSVILIVILSGLYALSPIDAIPDFLLVAGQIDDLATLLAGGGSVAFITALRPLVIAILKRPLLRTGCLIVALISLIALVGSALLVFYGLYSLVESL